MTTGLPSPISSAGIPLKEFNLSGRPTVALIDLNALSTNYQAVKAAIGANRDLLAVVKAEGYGHGAPEAARAFLEAGASWLGVATVEEGETLRGALASDGEGRGGGTRILVMSGTSPDMANRVVAKRLDAVVWGLDQVEALSSAARLAGAEARVHVKVDSGMHRLGMAPGEASDFIRKAAAMDGIEVMGLMSHLAQADEEFGEEPTKDQFNVIRALMDSLREQGILPPIVHCANSAGGLVYPEAPGQLVRSGIALYGSLPRPARGVAARPAMTLKSAVIQVKDVPAGGRVGYGGTYKRSTDGKIAVVAIGYADGYPRLLSNRADALVRGQRAPVIGRVSMDMLTIDITGREDIRVGDEVVLLGEQGGETIFGDELASRVHTISYEIFSRVGVRVPRVFVKDDRIIGMRTLGGDSSSLHAQERGDL